MPGIQDSLAVLARPGDLHMDSGISVRVLGAFDETEVSREQWDAFVAATNGNFYMTFDWCQVWWNFYGHDRDIRILVFRHRGELIAILPMFVETLWLGPVWLRVGKLVGGDFSIQLCNPPIAEGRSAAVLTEVIRYFIETRKCDAVILSPLSAHSNEFRELESASREGTVGALLAQDAEIDCHSIFKLRPDFEGYLKSLRKSQRTNYRRDLNFLNKSFVLTTDMVSEPDRVSDEFSAFRQMHAAQWRAEGKLGHFEDYPSGYEFNLELIKAHAEHGNRS